MKVGGETSGYHHGLHEYSSSASLSQALEPDDASGSYAYGQPSWRHTSIHPSESLFPFLLHDDGSSTKNQKRHWLTLENEFLSLGKKSYGKDACKALATYLGR